MPRASESLYQKAKSGASRMLGEDFKRGAKVSTDPKLRTQFLDYREQGGELQFDDWLKEKEAKGDAAPTE